MARIVGNPFRVSIISWSEVYFYVSYTDDVKVHNGVPVLPLEILLHEHEMQEWVKNPHGMDANFEPDLRRPGKFRVKSPIL